MNKLFVVYAILLFTIFPKAYADGGIGGGGPPGNNEDIVIIDALLEFGTDFPLTVADPTTGIMILNPRLSELKITSRTMLKVMGAAVAKKPIFLNKGDDGLIELKAESIDFLKNNLKGSLGNGQSLILKEKLNDNSKNENSGIEPQ